MTVQYAPPPGPQRPGPPQQWAPPTSPPPGTRPPNTTPAGPGRRRRWYGLATIVTALAVLVSIVMTLNARPAETPPVARWVGADGTRTGYAPGSAELLIEVAALPARSLPMAAPWIGGVGSFEDAAGRTWVLETTHPDGAQRYFDMGEQGLLERAVESAGQWQAYLPGRMVLPRDPRAGDTFESSGTLSRSDGTSAAYRTRGEITADGDCLLIRLTDTIEGTETTTQQTRCPGRGLVGFTDERGTWRGGDLRPPVVVSTTAGTPAGRLTGTPQLTAGMLSRNEVEIGLNAVSPVAHFTSGGHVIAGQSEGVVIAFDDDLGVLWQRIPGGYITSVTAFGDLIVVTTSWARAIGYDRTGTVVWEQTLADVAVGAPTGLDDRTLVLRIRDGGVVALDLRDGTQRWESRHPDPAAGIRVANGQILLAGSETVRALTLDGRGLWEVETGARVVSALATPEGWWVADSFSGVRLISPDGTVLHRRYVPGGPREMWPVEGGLILVSESVVMRLSADGSERWRVPAVSAVTSAPLADGVLVLGTERAFTVTAEGRRVDLPDELSHNSLWKLSVDPQGRIWLTGSANLLGRWQ